MKYFNTDFALFLYDLGQNNNKIWFDENRKRYENNVKIPFEKFTTDLLHLLSIEDNSLSSLKFNDVIFRINKDVRFSKDKTPYKTNRSALISPNGRKDIENPGLYYEFTESFVRIYVGIYFASTKQKEQIRNYIFNNIEIFQKLYKDKDFVKYYKDIKGDKNKTIPINIRQKSENEPLLYNKSWYSYSEISIDNITEDDFIDQFINVYKIGKPISNFLNNALS